MLLLIRALTNGVVGNKEPCRYFKIQVWGPLRMALVKIVYFNKLFHIIPYNILLESKHILDLIENSKKMRVFQSPAEFTMCSRVENFCLYMKLLLLSLYFVQTTTFKISLCIVQRLTPRERSTPCSSLYAHHPRQASFFTFLP